MKLKLVIISGSHRQRGQSHKVSQLLYQSLLAQDITCQLVNLYDLDLPLFDSKSSRQTKTWQSDLTKVKQSLVAADGLILVSPEYNGSMSPAILNLMLYIDGQTLAHKPVLLVGVSSGRGGAYPIANMKQNGFKDPQAVIIPQNLIVSYVEDIFQDEAKLTNLKEVVAKHCQYLIAYSTALKPLRQRLLLVKYLSDDAG